MSTPFSSVVNNGSRTGRATRSHVRLEPINQEAAEKDSMNRYFKKVAMTTSTARFNSRMKQLDVHYSNWVKEHEYHLVKMHKLSGLDCSFEYFNDFVYKNTIHNKKHKQILN